MAVPNTVDAYKSIIDFNKTIISIALSILTALVAYVIYQSIDLKIFNSSSIALIILSIIMALFGFGGAIQTVKDETPRSNTILITNLSAVTLIIGIIFILFAFKHKQEKSIDEILIKIEKSTTTLNQKLSPKNMRVLDYENEKYTIVYKIDSLEHTVVYATKTNKIINIK